MFGKWSKKDIKKLGLKFNPQTQTESGAGKAENSLRALLLVGREMLDDKH